MADRADRSVALLSRVPGMTDIGSSGSPVMLRIDPAWDPIGGVPTTAA
jgi:hypothetical protein